MVFGDLPPPDSADDARLDWGLHDLGGRERCGRLEALLGEATRVLIVIVAG